MHCAWISPVHTWLNCRGHCNLEMYRYQHTILPSLHIGLGNWKYLHKKVNLVRLGSNVPAYVISSSVWMYIWEVTLKGLTLSPMNFFRTWNYILMWKTVVHYSNLYCVCLCNFSGKTIKGKEFIPRSTLSVFQSNHLSSSNSNKKNLHFYQTI